MPLVIALFFLTRKSPPTFAPHFDLFVVENMEKPMSEVDLSKKMRTSPTMHLRNYRNKEASINNDVNVEKGKTSSTTVIVAVPIVDSLFLF
ncbi:hypothetical protein Gohar_027069 [Gossypium harknessii]|uniref:Uncharacterized protein n=1 Tax=Gossypium harknessii TaxID=34285 RepID=A0A7J9HTL0_9ROSI|nr:hypothetical protein [Gossypium harknessii]